VIAPLVNLFRISVNDVFLPSMSRMQATGDVGGMMDMNGRANALVGTFVCPMLAFAFAFANELVTVVYTSAYAEAAPVMRLYVIGLAAGVVEIGSLLLLLRQGAFALRVNICALLLSVLISFYAAQRFGLPGAALGSVLAIYFDRFLTLKRIERETGIPLAKLQQWRVLALLFAFSAVAAGFAWVVVEQMLVLRMPLARLAAGATCLAAVYGTLHALTGPNRGWIGALLQQGNRA
jgi:O-antigen/teichoic acid export membrane protein